VGGKRPGFEVSHYLNQVLTLKCTELYIGCSVPLHGVCVTKYRGVAMTKVTVAVAFLVYMWEVKC
jgi:hypothetical protein